MLSLIEQMLPAVDHTAFVLLARATQLQQHGVHCSNHESMSKQRLVLLCWQSMQQSYNSSSSTHTALQCLTTGNKSTKVRTNLPRTCKYHTTSYNPDHPCEPSRHPFIQHIVISCIINTSWSQKINASARHAYQGDVARS